MRIFAIVEVALMRCSIFAPVTCFSFYLPPFFIDHKRTFCRFSSLRDYDCSSVATRQQHIQTQKKQPQTNVPCFYFTTSAQTTPNKHKKNNQATAPFCYFTTTNKQPKNTKQHSTLKTNQQYRRLLAILQQETYIPPKYNAHTMILTPSQQPTTKKHNDFLYFFSHRFFLAHISQSRKTKMQNHAPERAR